jgi:hypothetical protein
MYRMRHILYTQDAFGEAAMWEVAVLPLLAPIPATAAAAATLGMHEHNTLRLCTMVWSYQHAPNVLALSATCQI